MKVSKFSPCAFIFPILILLALSSQAQTLRGTVRNVDNGLPIAGALVSIQGQRSDDVLAKTQTDSTGKYVFGPLRPGYYVCKIEMQGFDNQTIAEINVVAGKERLVEIGLHSAASQLPEVTIAADQPGRRPMQPLSEIPLTRDQTLRFPAMSFDPARLAAAYPGVAQTDDGINGMSIRGNSPATMRWRLEGVDVVNPNHLPNAGTFNDRPASASGGILMFSSQLLDNSALLTGAFPAGYGDAISGVMDMHLRAGNDQHHEFTAQASLVGLDLAAEGPLSKREKAPSYVVNYRYSTVGLLSQMGVSFGDEEINFQDLSFNLNFPTKKGSWSVFGMGGLSENIFKHKTDSAEIEFDKDRYNIRFKSKTAILGTSGHWRWGRRTSANASFAASIQTNDWSKRGFAEGTIAPLQDEREDERLSGRLELKHNWARLQLTEGINMTYSYFAATIQEYSFNTSQLIFVGSGGVPLLQPWINAIRTSADGRWTVQVGLHSLLNVDLQKGTVDPRASLTFRASAKHTIALSGGIYSEGLSPWLQEDLVKPFLRSPQVVLAHTWWLTTQIKLHSEAFFQYQQYYPSIDDNSGRISWYNQPELLSNSFLGNHSTTVRNYGIECGAEKTLQQGWFLLANFSLFDSKFHFEVPGGPFTWLNSRWNLGHLANLTIGKEWTRDRSAEKVRVFGLNGRIVVTGGVREAELDLNASINSSTTVFNEVDGYNRQYADYFRVDIRAYWKRSLGNRRNSTFAMDLQNVTAQQNLAYHYYDPFTKNVETKYQLGLIPGISWRLEF